MMARSTYKLTLLLVWVVMVREVLTQDQTLPDTAAPSQQLLGPLYNQESENDATAMGRNAAEDMGSLMASPPMKVFRLPQMVGGNVQNQGESTSTYYDGYSNARENQAAPRCYPQQWYPGAGKSSGRSAVPRTIPLAPLPIVPGLSPLPLLSPLIQSLTNPGRLGLGFGLRPLLRTPAALPHYPQPLLKTPTPPYQLPRINRVWIPPSPLKARSSFTPNAYARSANQNRPSVFYI